MGNSSWCCCSVTKDTAAPVSTSILMVLPGTATSTVMGLLFRTPRCKSGNASSWEFMVVWCIWLGLCLAAWRTGPLLPWVAHLCYFPSILAMVADYFPKFVGGCCVLCTTTTITLTLAAWLGWLRTLCLAHVLHSQLWFPQMLGSLFCTIKNAYNQWLLYIPFTYFNWVTQLWVSMESQHSPHPYMYTWSQLSASEN